MERDFSVPNSSISTKGINPNIILKTFGLGFFKPKFYSPGAEPQTLKDRDFLIPTEPPGGTPVGTSYLGTPIFTNLVFKSGSYTLANRTVAYKGLEINTVLVDIQMAKNVVKTAVQGRNGTVKEYISDGDYEINIRGALVSPVPTLYPTDEVAALRDLCQVPDKLEVISSFLQLFSIHYLVIESFSFPQREGFYNTQLFELKCVSDLPIDLNA